MRSVSEWNPHELRAMKDMFDIFSLLGSLQLERSEKVPYPAKPSPKDRDGIMLPEPGRLHSGPY